MLGHVVYLIIFLQITKGWSTILFKKTLRTPQRNNHQNISNLLDSLLKGYDNSIRPDFGGPPAIIDVDIMVRSMGPVSEIDMTYSMDCYFRQSWVDRRLEFPGDTNDTLALSISMLGRIWKPDTYFYNGKHSYLHTITTPNKFVRLFQNGRVLYSSRLTIKAGCPMKLEDFPMDIQRCPLKFGSFGYTSQDVVYRWNTARQVAIADDMKLSQFDLIATPAANHTDTIINGDTKSGEFSMLLVSFHLRRHMGNFLIQVYGPCVLLVVLSWVSFWLNREATADRVSLGITTVLTMTFLGLEARTDLPKVPYPTALDFFVFLSFAFIFATIIQFAVVHYFTKYGSGECYFGSDFYSDSDSNDEEDWTSLQDYNMSSQPSTSKNISSSTPSKNSFIEVIPLTVCSITIPSSHRRPLHQPWSNLLCISSDNDKNKMRQQQKIRKTSSHHIVEKLSSYRHREQQQQQQQQQQQELQQEVQQQQQRRRKKRKLPRFNSVSKIDRASRVVFPFLFVAINIFYWYLYLSRTKRIQHLDVS